MSIENVSIVGFHVKMALEHQEALKNGNYLIWISYRAGLKIGRWPFLNKTQFFLYTTKMIWKRTFVLNQCALNIALSILHDVSTTWNSYEAREESKEKQAKYLLQNICTYATQATTKDQRYSLEKIVEHRRV